MSKKFRGLTCVDESLQKKKMCERDMLDYYKLVQRKFKYSVPWRVYWQQNENKGWIILKKFKRWNYWQIMWNMLDYYKERKNKR